MSNEATEIRIPEITLGWRLRMSMDHAGIKAEQMAAEFEVHRGTITRWTHDKGAPPRRRDLRDWAALCGVPFEWLVGDLFQDPTAEETPKPPRPRTPSTDVRSTKSSGRCTQSVVASRSLSVDQYVLVPA